MLLNECFHCHFPEGRFLGGTLVFGEISPIIFVVCAALALPKLVIGVINTCKDLTGRMEVIDSMYLQIPAECAIAMDILMLVFPSFVQVSILCCAVSIFKVIC